MITHIAPEEIRRSMFLGKSTIDYVRDTKGI
jgi:hypothetical protein